MMKGGCLGSCPTLLNNAFGRPLQVGIRWGELSRCVQQQGQGCLQACLRRPSNNLHSHRCSQQQVLRWVARERLRLAVAVAAAVVLTMQASPHWQLPPPPHLPPFRMLCSPRCAQATVLLLSRQLAVTPWMPPYYLMWWPL